MGLFKHLVVFVLGFSDISAWFLVSRNKKVFIGVRLYIDALSTAEAGSLGGCQALWMEWVLHELKQFSKVCPAIYFDNNATITISKDPVLMEEPSIYASNITSLRT